MEKLEPCAEQLKLLDDFTKLMVAPACGQALENATKLVTVFPVAVLTTITPLSSMKSLTNSSWDDRFTVKRTFVGGVVLLLLLLLLLLGGVVPSSLEHACIMQLIQVNVRPPVIWLMNDFLSM
jgi:flagellar biosynthesis protein FlhB